MPSTESARRFFNRPKPIVITPRTLATLRDTLLPKLLSGDLSSQFQSLSDNLHP